MHITNALKTAAAAAAIGGLALAVSSHAQAQGRSDILIAVGEQGPNSLDTHGTAANDYTRMIAWNVYDRLVSHGTKTLDDGTVVYDVNTVTPELAESWEVSEDGTVITFHLRKDAVFHDGSPVTAHDVKWSFDRAVTVGGFPSIQMAAGSFEKPEQFKAIDDHTFQITLPKANKLALPDLTVPVPIVINADVAKEHATEEDPWALEWLQRNTAGGGAYEIEAWRPGSEIVFSRFEDWKSGPLPAMQRVVYRQVPSAGTRRALIERGDVDISIGLPPKDFAEMEEAGDINVVGVPVQSAVLYIDMNVAMPPFDNKLVRKAVAYAVPYEEIMSSALYGRALPMFGAEPGAPYEPTWPVPSPYHTDLEKAKALLTEAGFPDGFETQLYYDLGQATTREPIALLVQESLGKIGIRAQVNKVPGSNWFAQMAEKSMPMVVADFYAWLDWPEYHFFWTYHGGNNSVFNTANYVNPTLDAMIDQARFETDQGVYENLIKDMVGLVMEEVPRVPILRWYLDTAMQPNIEGYTYWFHTMLDFRTLSKE
ncbi:MAG: ABC transporter substrate-binding protein [Rhodospirillaceae bacterium]|nr:ABC transporter substrate-binding protein [Rhodospirillaceae bacterium]